MNKQNKTINTKSTSKFSVGTTMNFSSEAGIGLPITRGTTSYRKEKYISYSSYSRRYNTNNVFPQVIANFAVESPTNQAALDRKTMMIQGEGIDLTKVNANLRRLLNNLNEDGMTINDLLYKVSRDYATFGGYALKITWGNDGYIRYIDHIPFEDVRIGEPFNNGRKIDIPYYVVSNNWDTSLTTSLETVISYPAFNPNYFGKDSIPRNELGLPIPTEEQINQSEQILYCFDSRPKASSGMNFYPVPDYMAAFDAIGTEIEILKSNKSLLDNGFGGKTIITLPTLPSTQEERDELDMQIKQQFASASNNGGVMTLFNNDPNLKVNVEQLQALDANTYIELDKNIKQAIITAHKIPAILLEYNYGGGFNNRAEEMVVAYEQFQRTVIKSYQQSILAVFNRLMKYVGWEDKLEIIPFTLNPIVDSTTEQIIDVKPSKINSNDTSNNNDSNVSTQQESSLESN